MRTMNDLVRLITRDIATEETDLTRSRGNLVQVYGDEFGGDDREIRFLGSQFQKPKVDKQPKR